MKPKIKSIPAAKDKQDLSDLMADLREDSVYRLVERQIAGGVDPLTIIDQCHKGMVRVGQRYESGRYFISGLIMAGEIMQKVGELVLPLMGNKAAGGHAGKIVLGTVAGDIHFIGKDIFKILVRGYGFSVYDLGVDVSPATFLAAADEVNPDIVGLCCLVSTAYKSMSEAIAYLRKNMPPPKKPLAYIIGGLVTGRVCKEVGADGWADDGMRGVRLCQQIMEKARAV